MKCNHLERRNIFHWSLFLSFFSLFGSANMEEMMRAVTYETGGPENLKISQVPKPKLQENEVLVEVHFAGINRADVIQRKGSYPVPGSSQVLGLEVSGVIHELGKNCALGWRKGDRVMALLSGGGYARYVAVNENLVMPVPGHLDLSYAAAIPEVWLTAYQILHFLAKVQKDETVLIHGGGSGVGTAMIQLARQAGAIPLVTAGSEKKLELATALGAKAVFNYKTGGFSTMVQKETNGAGVHVIADCVGGSFWDENMKSIGTDGRWVLYGLLGGSELDKQQLSMFMRKRITFMGTLLRPRSLEYKTELVKAFVENSLPHFATDNLKPIIHTILPMEDIQEAHELMERNENTGKIIIQVTGGDAHEEL